MKYLVDVLEWVYRQRKLVSVEFLKKHWWLPIAVVIVLIVLFS